MAVQRDERNGQWRYRKVVRLPDGTKVRISGMPSDNTRLAAEDAERAHIRRALEPVPTRKEVPTFAEWFEGRFWDERRLDQLRTGLVLRDLDGSAKTDRQADCALWRICDRAGLPRRGWHTLRHTFATHAAMFGVNPWRLMRWLGHKRLDVTMVYVNMAEAHARPIPPAILTAGAHQQDPDRRILAMLAARGNSVTTSQVTDEQTGGVSTA